MHADDATTERATLETPAATLAYDEAGTGVPVVFVHSGLTDRRMWDPQWTAFADRYRTVRYDLQGFGESTATAAGTDREDLLALLDGLGLDSVHLAGASFGSSVALEATLEAPDRVRSLTLVGPTVGGDDYEDNSALWQQAETRSEEAVAAFQAGDLERAAELEVDLWVVGPGRSPGDIDSSLREQVIQTNLAALRREAAGDRRTDRVALDPPAVDRLDDIVVPMLVVAGEYDLPHVHAATRRLEHEVPDVRRAIFEDTAHLPNLERPMAFTTRVIEFLETV